MAQTRGRDTAATGSPGSRCRSCHIPERARGPTRIVVEECVPIPRKDGEVPMSHISPSACIAVAETSMRAIRHVATTRRERGDEETPWMCQWHLPSLPK